MKGATAWGDSWFLEHPSHGPPSAQVRDGWTVLGRLQWRSERRRVALERPGGMDAASAERGDHWMLALLFAQPDAAAMRELARHGDYFDLRSGASWDLLFPGYSWRYADPGADAPDPSTPGDRPAARERSWMFTPADFNDIRDVVAAASAEAGRAWVYSGGTDLVLVSVQMPPGRPVVVEWSTTVSCVLPDTEPRALSRTIERVSTGLERWSGDDPLSRARLRRMAGDGGVVRRIGVVLEDLAVRISAEVIRGQLFG